jgi:hypothetical protein
LLLYKMDSSTFLPKSFLNLFIDDEGGSSSYSIQDSIITMVSIMVPTRA